MKRKKSKFDRNRKLVFRSADFLHLRLSASQYLFSFKVRPNRNLHCREVEKMSAYSEGVKELKSMAIYAGRRCQIYDKFYTIEVLQYDRDSAVYAAGQVLNRINFHRPLKNTSNVAVFEYGLKDFQLVYINLFMYMYMNVYLHVNLHDVILNAYLLLLNCSIEARS